MCPRPIFDLGNERRAGEHEFLSRLLDALEGARKVRDREREYELFGFLTIDPNEIRAEPLGKHLDIFPPESILTSPTTQGRV